MASPVRTGLVVGAVIMGVFVSAVFVGIGVVVKKSFFPARPSASEVVTVDARVRLDPIAGGTAVRLTLTPTDASRSRQVYLSALTVDIQFIVAGGGGPHPTREGVERTDLRVNGRPVRKVDDVYGRFDVYGPIDASGGPLDLTFTVPAVRGRRIVLPLDMGERLRVRDLQVDAEPGVVTSCLRLTGYSGTNGYNIMTRCGTRPPLRLDTLWPVDRKRQGVVRLELAPSAT